METRVKISSFAAPTPDDIAAFKSLTPEEQRALIEAELDKGFEGEAVALTGSTAKDIFSRAMTRVAGRHAAS